MVRVSGRSGVLFILETTHLAGLKKVLNWPIPKPCGPGVVLSQTAISLAAGLQMMFRQMRWKVDFKTLPAM